MDRFWQHVWQEVEPITIHAVVVFVLQLAVLLNGLMTLLLETMFPKHDADFLWLERIEIWISLVLWSMFGVYTLVIVGIRLFQAVREALMCRRCRRDANNPY